MLEEASAVGHSAKVAQTERWQLTRPLCTPRDALGTWRMQAIFANLGEKLLVLLGNPWPRHLAAELVAALAHRVALGIVIEQPDNLLRDGARVAEGHDNTTTIVEQFFGMPVGGGDNRLAGADGVGERARDDLLAVEVRRDVDVGAPMNSTRCSRRTNWL